jgi:hypothetical protein
VKHVLLASLILVAGAADARGVHPRHLEPVVEGAVHTLAAPFVFREKAATFTLAAGDYRVAFEDRRHWYLIGAANCLEMHVVPPKNPAAQYRMPFDCGIRLPKDAAGAAEFFVVRATPDTPARSGQGLVVDAIIRAGYGKFDFPARLPPDNTLRSQLAVAGS